MHALSVKRLIWPALMVLALLLGAHQALAAGAPSSFADLAQKVSPSVVNIRTAQTVAGPSDERMRDMQEFFRRFFGDNLPPGMEPGPQGEAPQAQPHKRRGLGSGVVISGDGYILTNNHVVENADEITVAFKDGTELPGKVVGTDPKTDVALVRVEPKHDLPYLELGDSTKLRVGDWVIAVGNPYGLEHTVTAGIVSATGRVIGAGPYDDFIQTDASINPGNSGGPLINLDGEVVGINTAIIQQAQGIGFAIPINLAKSVMGQLKEHGKVIRGWLGVMIQPVTNDIAQALKLPDTHGALVGDVTPDSPAAKAGIKRGDVIVEFEGKKVEDWNRLPSMVAASPVGMESTVKVIRDGKASEIKVKLGELPGEMAKAGATTGKGQQDNLDKMGLGLQEVTPDLAKQLGLDEAKGLLVTQVSDGPAAEAGLARGDVILEANNSQVKDLEKFRGMVDDLKPGEGMLLLVQRKNATQFLVLKAPK